MHYEMLERQNMGKGLVLYGEILNKWVKVCIYSVGSKGIIILIVFVGISELDVGIIDGS